MTDAIYAANPRALIAVDEEGGDVTRLFHDVGSPSPGNAVLGRIDDLGVTQDDAAQIGWALRRLGCNVNFAPTVDINSNPDNPVIGTRSFGVDAERVAAHSAAWTTGLQATGVAASAKHFPGHGDTAQDSHLSLPVIDRSLEDLRSRELRPFAAAIAAGTRLVMTSHILLPQLDAENPATMSRDILIGLLREELGFAGVIVSDALDMAGASAERGVPDAAVRSLRAGCDLLCLGTDNTDDELTEIERAVHAAIADGSLAAERVSDAAERVRALADDLAIARPPYPQGRVGHAWPGGMSALVEAIDVQPAARTWRAAHLGPLRGRPARGPPELRRRADGLGAVRGGGPRSGVGDQCRIRRASAVRGDHRRPHAQRIESGRVGPGRRAGHPSPRVCPRRRRPASAAAAERAGRRHGLAVR